MHEFESGHGTADGVERVRGELVVALEYLHHVELDAALDVDLLGLSSASLLRLEHLVLHPRHDA